MSLDDFQDVRVNALLMLASGAANADLQETAGESVVKVGVSAPIDIDVVGAGNLPALYVYRTAATLKEETQFVLNAYSTFAVEYWAPLCPRDKMLRRWPLLWHVWASIAKALQGGMHPQVSGGAPVLAQAGLRAELGNTTTVQFRRGASDGGFYPFFSASMRFYEEVAVDVGVADIEGMDLFLRLRTDWRLPGADGDTPEVASLLWLDGYPAVVGMSGDMAGNNASMSGDQDDALEGMSYASDGD